MCFCLLPVTGLNLKLFLPREVLRLRIWTILAIFALFFIEKKYFSCGYRCF